MALGIAALLFVFTAGIILLFGYRRYVRAGQAYENLAGAEVVAAAPAAPGFYVITQIAERIGERLPPSPSNASKFRKELIAAGYRSDGALAAYFGIKVTLAAGLCLAAVLLQFRLDLTPMMQVLYIAVAALGGYRLPDFVLARRVKAHRKRLRKALPDALDLMVLCSTAGLALDRTIRIVGRELAPVHPVLSDELNLLTLEVTAGTRRREALENLAVRTQEPEVRKFVTVLVQADRFGTEIGEALRNHAEYLRVRRRLEAEERAGKVSVKLVFPIFLFILPCIILVTVGPAAIQIWKTLLPALKG